jgi:hypothetical protein
MVRVGHGDEVREQVSGDYSGCRQTSEEETYMPARSHAATVSEGL